MSHQKPPNLPPQSAPLQQRMQQASMLYRQPKPNRKGH